MLPRYFVKQSYCIPFYLGNWSSRRWRWYLSNSPSKFIFSPMNTILWVEGLGKGILFWLQNPLIHKTAINSILNYLCGIYETVKIGSWNSVATKVIGRYYNKVPTIFRRKIKIVHPFCLKKKKKKQKTTLVTSLLRSLHSPWFFFRYFAMKLII